MVANMEQSILKELDRQNFRANIISTVMKHLDTNDKKSMFLSFLIENRGTILEVDTLLNKLKEIKQYN